MADISATIKGSLVKHGFQNPIVERTYLWDPVGGVGAGGTATSTAATHNLIPVPVGEALLDGYFVVTQAFTSAGAATVQFKTGEGNFTGAVPKADLAIGEVIPLYPVASITAVAGVAHYVDGTTVTAETFDVAVGTATLTAGKGYLVLRFVSVSSIQNAI